MIGRALVGAGVLAVSACTTLGPDFETPDADLLETWDEQAQSLSAGQAPENWWASFNDPVLDQLVKMAYEQNLPLQISGLRILEARAQLGVAIGQQYPQNQQVNGALTRIGVSDNTANFDSSFADDKYTQGDIGFDAAWELDFWGRFRRGVESASGGVAEGGGGGRLVVDPNLEAELLGSADPVDVEPSTHHRVAVALGLVAGGHDQAATAGGDAQQG